MAHNNDALYDAVVAGAGGGAQHGWLVLSTPASYTPFATNIDILATAVDLQIPVIAGGASISQINLLQSITQSVLTARYPVPVAPATYVDIAKAIAAVYTELEKLLTNQPTVASYGVNWLVADWYIDGTVGDDANSGVVIGAPLKTGAELLRRLGPYAMWPQSVTVHVLANGMTDALVLRGLMMVVGTYLDVVGTPTQVADAGTVATYTAINHATPEATLISTTGIADWSLYERRRLRVTSGPRAGAIVWLGKANPAGLGVATVRTTRTANIDTVSASTMTSFTTMVIGDPVVVESLPTVPAIELFIDGSISSLPAISLWTQRQWSLLHISTPAFAVQSPANAGLNGKMVFGCRLSRVNWGQQATLSTLNTITAYGCSFFLETGTNFVVLVNLNSCLIGEGFTLTSVTVGLAWFHVVSQGSALMANFGVPMFGSDLQIFDTVGATTQACNVSAGSITNLSGRGNAGYGIAVTNNANLKLNGTQNLQGTVSNGRLTSTPATSLTLPQLLQPSDYAQKGITPAMVAGTTTVTVPWYDNATQQVTVSHAAFAGTPGILSVQQISTTQFTITSSSVLDTSTVRWHISPLGRNIFISTV